ncbi:MAG: hypothetical protein GXP49_18700 [Deltaproteobacteria bacterium]|nr:hypothetical protein [Deltaproteobacteria bacterium]
MAKPESRVGIAGVECNSSYKVPETPVRFFFGGADYEVERITKRWREQGKGGRILEKFEVLVKGHIWMLTYDTFGKIWVARDLGRAGA